VAKGEGGKIRTWPADSLSAEIGIEGKNRTPIVKKGGEKPASKRCLLLNPSGSGGKRRKSAAAGRNFLAEETLLRGNREGIGGPCNAGGIASGS